MSASFYATAVYGFYFNRESLKQQLPNPKYNPEAPFDPKTGKRIPQFIENDNILKSLLIDAENLGFKETNTTDQKETFIGVIGKSCTIGEDKHEFSSPNDFDIIDTHNKLKTLAEKYGIHPKLIRFYAVGYCSY